MENKSPLVEGAWVGVLTPSYHWTGRVVGCDALRIWLEEAILYVEIGQIVDVCKGKPSKAHGDPVAGVCEIPRPSAQVIALSAPVEHKQYRG